MSFIWSMIPWAATRPERTHWSQNSPAEPRWHASWAAAPALAQHSPWSLHRRQNWSTHRTSSRQARRPSTTAARRRWPRCWGQKGTGNSSPSAQTSGAPRRFNDQREPQEQAAQPVVPRARDNTPPSTKGSRTIGSGSQREGPIHDGNCGWRNRWMAYSFGNGILGCFKISFLMTLFVTSRRRIRPDRSWNSLRDLRSLAFLQFVA